MNNIKIVDYSKIYNQGIKDIIIEQWFSDYNFKNSVINSYATGYLYMYLAKSNYTKVVLKDNQPIAFIFAKVGSVSIFNTIKYNIKLFFSCFNLLFTKHGRRGLKINRITNKVNKNLYKEYKNIYKNCIELFIVKKNERNKGIGSILITKLHDYIQKTSTLPIYLFSDSYSNFDFYLKHNYQILKEVDVDFKVEGETISKYCIIGKTID